MRHLLTFTCLLALPAVAQMRMPDNSMPDNPAPAHHEAKSQPAARKRARQGTASQEPDRSFGELADGDTAREPRAVPATPSPMQRGSTVQEQEHPERRTGSDTPMPDLLAELKDRASEPLSFFTERAAANNPTLRQAEAEVRRLHAEAKQAGLWQNPEVGYEADHIRGGSYAGGEQGGYVQQNIPLGGQRSASRAAVEARATAAESVLTAQRQRVDSAVAQAFYAALILQQEAELRGQVAALAGDAAIAAHQLANIGQADAPDVLQSEIEREQAKLDLASSQRAYRKAFAKLAALSGDGLLPLAHLRGDLTGVPVLQEETAFEIADASPTLETVQREALAGELAVHSAQRQAWPQLIVKGGLQQDNEPLDAGLRRVGVVGIAQAGLTVPLWNRNQGAVEAATAQVASAQAEVARTRLQLRLQAEQAMEDYANAMAQAQRYRDELLPRARRAVELYQQKYAAMAAAYPQIVAAQKVFLRLQQEYARALGTAWQNALVLQHGLLRDGLAAPGMVGTQAGLEAGN